MKRDVAIVALINDEKEIFLVRTHAYPYAWQPVGGGIDKEDASPEDAAIRETHEEVGILLHSIKHIAVVPFDFGEGSVYCFQSHIPSNTALTIDEEEIAEYGWFSHEDAKLLPAYPATQACINNLFLQ